MEHALPHITPGGPGVAFGLTLMAGLATAIIGVPFLLAWTIGIYWVFRGKVRLDSMSC